jgi:hypothetical protein
MKRPGESATQGMPLLAAASTAVSGSMLSSQVGVTIWLLSTSIFHGQILWHTARAQGGVAGDQAPLAPPPASPDQASTLLSLGS